MLIDHPEMASEIFQAVALEEMDIDELYNAVKDTMLPDGTIMDDSDWAYNNVIVKGALEAIAQHCGYASIAEYEYDEENMEDRKRHSAEISEFQETLSDNISYGVTPDELREICEMHGYTLEEWYDADTLKEAYEQHGYEYNPEDNSISKIVREQKPGNKAFLDWLEEGDKKSTPLQQREVSVSEIGDLAKSTPKSIKDEAINAVTSPEEEKIQEGQSHDDE